MAGFGSFGGFGGFGNGVSVPQFGGNVNNQLAFQAATLQQAASDQFQAENIFAQVQAEQTRAQVQRWQIHQELQTKIHSITAKVTLNKAKSADKAFNAITSYISS